MRLIDWDALINEAGKLWSEMPDGVELSKELMKAINHAPTVATETNVLDKWISVKDSTPTVMHLDCWVMIKGCPIPEMDYWEGDRGEESTGVFPDGEKTFVKSGWYYNDCNEVTHWMPISRPEPPEEVSGDGETT